MGNKTKLGDFYTSNNELDDNVTISFGNNSHNVYINSTGLYVNNAQIINSSGIFLTGSISLSNTITANSSNGTSGYVLTSAGDSGNVYWAVAAPGTNVNASYTWTNTHTFQSNVILTGNSTSVLTVSTINTTSNGVFVGNNVVQVGNTSVYANLTPQNLYIGGNVIANSTGANNAFNLGGIAASSYQLNSTLNANISAYLPIYTGVVNSSSYTIGTGFTANSTVVNAVSYYAGTTLIGNTIGPYGKTESNLNVNNALTSNNSSYLGGNLPAYYTNATNITTGTLPYAQLGTNVVNTTANFTITGMYTYSNGITVSNTITANGSNGTSGYVLTSAGATGNVYWAAAAGGGSVNTAASYVWTNTHTFNSNTTVGNATFANTTLTSYSGFSNPQSLTSGVFQTNASLNTVLVGPYTISTGNSLVITTGSRVVII